MGHFFFSGLRSENKNKSKPQRSRGCAEKFRECNGIVGAFVARDAGQGGFPSLAIPGGNGNKSSLSATPHILGDSAVKRKSHFHALGCAPGRMKDCFKIAGWKLLKPSIPFSPMYVSSRAGTGVHCGSGFAALFFFLKGIAGTTIFDEGVGMVGAGAPVAMRVDEFFLGDEEFTIAALELFIFNLVIASFSE
jgi:hypothetical protein